MQPGGVAHTGRSVNTEIVIVWPCRAQTSADTGDSVRQEWKPTRRQAEPDPDMTTSITESPLLRFRSSAYPRFHCMAQMP
jgi:hypothetical protein